MVLKILTLLLLTFLCFNIKANASLIFLKKLDDSASKKQVNAVRKSNFIAFKALAGSTVFPSQFASKNIDSSKDLSLKADFWFAFIAIGGMASMWLIKPNKD